MGLQAISLFPYANCTVQPHLKNKNTIAMTVSSSNGNSPPHVMIIPFPAQGHMIPLLDLTHKLASHGGLTVTVFTTPKNLNLLNPLLSAHPSINTLVLPFPSHPSVPPGIENVKDSPHSVWAIMLAMAELHDPLLYWFKSHPSPPQSIISDMFSSWTQRLASQLGIRRLVFSPSGALALSTMYFLWNELPKRKNDSDENEVVSYYKLPNCPKYPWWQVSFLYRSYVKGDPDSANYKEAFRANMDSWALIVNSFNDLEMRYLDYLRRELGHDRVWAVGPLLPPPGHDVAQRGWSSSVSVEDLMSWLDKCEDRKVVYVSFGSQTFLTKDQMESVASALEKSKVHFVWSVKEKEKDEDHPGVVTVPSGFEDRTAGRGLVIREWAPQVLILRHRAVGTFLSHCGWNSVLESVVAGVPVLAWPMSFDQFSSATLLVEQLKMGKRVCEGATMVPNSDKLAGVLTEFTSSCSVETSQALKLQEAAMNAIGEEGSSDKDLQCLIEHLAGLAM